MNDWDRRYDNDDFFYGEEANQFLQEQVHLFAQRSPLRILCLAEGEGRNAVFLAEEGKRLGHNWEVVAVDMSSVGLKKLQKLAEKKGVQVKTIVADLSSFDFGLDSWDVVVSIWCHLPIPLRQDVHRKVIASLKTAGLVVLQAYTEKQLQNKTGGPPRADMMMSLSALRTEFAGLTEMVGAELDCFISEGKGHHGPSSVVNFIGLKG